MSIFFSSDQHMWHANILKYNPNRPWKTIEEMNEGLLRNWNSVVGPDDTIYCLGDFSFAARPVELYSHRLNGQKKIIFGNHDPGHFHNKHYKKAVNRGEPNYWKEFYERHGWEVLPLTTTLDIPGVSVVNMSHMPYDNQDTRYTQYLPKDDGRWLLHGHTHSLVKARGKQISVGVDSWNCYPVPLDEIIKIIKENPEGVPCSNN